MTDPAPRLRPLGLDDIAACLRLSAAAGWNQTAADWRRLIGLAAASRLAAEVDGRVVGTALGCRFDAVGWVAMVLVDPAVRRRGIGGRLVAAAIEGLHAAGARTLRLDATALGRPVYERLGFVAEWEVDRWAGEVGHAAGGDLSATSPADRRRLAEAAALDRAASGCDRTPLLASLAADCPAGFFIRGPRPQATGFAMTRPGANAAQIGPVVAMDEPAGTRLFEAAFAALAAGPVYVDIPADNAAAARWAAARGLKPLRRFVRMRLGAPLADRPPLLWASSGPELG